MIQKGIRLRWFDWFARNHFRGRIGLHWVWVTFFARRYALDSWQTVFLQDILWEYTIGADEDRLIVLVSSWLHKALDCWYPDGRNAAIDLVLRTTYDRAGWFAVNCGPRMIPEVFPAIMKAATDCAREIVRKDEYPDEAHFRIDVRKRLMGQT